MTTLDWVTFSAFCLAISNLINFILINQLQRKIAELEKRAKL